jgi:FkbM family methyltransferase
MKTCDIVRPLLRVCPRPSMAVLGYLGAGFGADPQWRDVQPRYRSYFDRQLQCIMTSDLVEWGGRACYYWGRFFDVAHQAVLREHLVSGDTYIDIGANIGYQSLYASRLVGPNGQVLSFEPNPPTYAILAGHVAINRIKNCRTFQVALSNTAGEAVLNQLEEHSGTSTLMQTGSKAFRSVSVPMRVGDDILKDIPFSGKAFLKMDVEGFELQALIGLRETLNRVAMVWVEVTPEWLLRQGGSAQELFRYMEQAGFRPFLPTLHWAMGLWGARMELAPLAQPLDQQHDVLFVR